MVSTNGERNGPADVLRSEQAGRHDPGWTRRLPKLRNRNRL